MEVGTSFTPLFAYSATFLMGWPWATGFKPYATTHIQLVLFHSHILLLCVWLHQCSLSMPKVTFSPSTIYKLDIVVESNRRADFDHDRKLQAPRLTHEQVPIFFVFQLLLLCWVSLIITLIGLIIFYCILFDNLLLATRSKFSPNLNTYTHCNILTLISTYPTSH
jgi:hypothetical protein